MSVFAMVVTALLLITNLTAFIMMGADKAKARKQHGGNPETRRTPEKNLFIAAGAFGAVGGTLGMLVFRHKTKHWYFALFFPLMAVLQIAIIIYLTVIFH